MRPSERRGRCLTSRAEPSPSSSRTSRARRACSSSFASATATCSSTTSAFSGRPSKRPAGEIDTQGDAFFVAFPTAKDAVSAALAGQRALDAHAWPDGVEVKVRMGIHTAEPALGGERYVGLGVHRAARICAAAHGGQVPLSEAARAVSQDELPDGVALRDLGEHTLKDFDRPERLFQLLAADLPGDFPALRTREEETAFAGREGELAEAAQAAVAGRPPPEAAHAPPRRSRGRTGGGRRDPDLRLGARRT